VHAPDAGGIEKLANARPDDRHPRPRAKTRNLKPETVGERDVVGIEPGQEAPRGPLESSIQGGGEAKGTLVAKHDQAAVLDASEGLAGAVLRAVVDDDELQVAKGLAEDTPRRGGYVALGIAGGEEDGDEGHGMATSDR
jgi:hypothetical protein